MTSELAGIGILYPGHAAEADYDLLNTRCAGIALFEVVHTSIGEDAHREDSLLDMGSHERLREGAGRLPSGLSAVVWACTSASFIYGWEGARRQVAALEDEVRVPVSSTSLAYVNALRALGLRRVAVAATYPDDIARRFETFLVDAGLEPLSVASHGIVTATEVSTLERDETVALVRTAESPGRRSRARAGHGPPHRRRTR